METKSETPPLMATPAHVLFVQVMAAIKEADLPPIWQAELQAKILALKPELPNDPYSQIVAHIKVVSLATAQMAQISAEIDDNLLTLIGDKLPEYAALQMLKAEAEAAAELVAREHPEWFDPSKTKKRTVETPFGSAKMHGSSSLEVADKDRTLELMDTPEVRKEVAAILQRTFKAIDYRRESVELNLEALENLPDAALERLAIQRTRKDNFTVTAAKVAMGAHVKAAAKKAAKAAKGSEVTA